MLKKLAGLAAVAGAVTLAVPSPAMLAASRLYGHWQVVSVAVPDVGVQALATNDPSYMGRRLTFTRTRLSWDKQKNSTETPCAAPTIKPTAPITDPDALATARKIGGPALRVFSIGCAAGSWGPGEPPAPALFLLRDGTLGLWWYDNGLLKLRRVG